MNFNFLSQSLSFQSDSVEEKTVRNMKECEEMMCKSVSSDYAASTDSQNLSEYTYEAAIENYKSRVMKVANSSNILNLEKPKVSLPDPVISRKRSEGSKIEERLLSMEMKLNSNNNGEEKEVTPKEDLPKVNIAKRRELFEESSKNHTNEKSSRGSITEIVPQIKSIKQRMSEFKTEESECHSTFNIDVDISNVKGRFLILEKNVNSEPSEKPKSKVDVPLSVSIKDRLSSLQSCVESSSNNNNAKANNKEKPESVDIESRSNLLKTPHTETVDTDREDSGIHTTDISCSVSQADEQNDERFFDINSLNIEANNRIEEQAEQNVIEISSPVEDSFQVESVDEVISTQNFSMPDLVQHNPVPASFNTEESTTHDDNVSLSFSESATESVICDGSLLLDVKNLIETLASTTTISDKVEESSIYSNDFEETTTFNNTSSMFDETTANDDDSSIISSLPSPYHHQTNNPENNNYPTLTPPSLNLNLTSVKANIELSPISPDQTPMNNELVLDYFNKSPCKRSDTSSPRSPSRSILNFIKTNLLHSSNEQIPQQESSKFYVSLNDESKNNNQEMKNAPVLEKKDSIESNGTLTHDINSALDEEIMKL